MVLLVLSEVHDVSISDFSLIMVLLVLSEVHDISISDFSLIMVLLVLSEVLIKHIKQTQNATTLQFASC